MSLYITLCIRLLGSNDSLVIAVKPKTKYRLRAAFMLYYSLQNLLQNSSIFFENTSPKTSGACATMLVVMLKSGG